MYFPILVIFLLVTCVQNAPDCTHALTLCVGMEVGDYSTINGALTAAHEGSRIYVRTGVYTENLYLSHGGTVDIPNELSVFDSADVTINGCVVISSIWKVHQGHGTLTITGTSGGFNVTSIESDNVELGPVSIKPNFPSRIGVLVSVDASDGINIHDVDFSSGQDGKFSHFVKIEGIIGVSCLVGAGTALSTSHQFFPRVVIKDCTFTQKTSETNVIQISDRARVNIESNYFHFSNVMSGATAILLEGTSFIQIFNNFFTYESSTSSRTPIIETSEHRISVKICQLKEINVNNNFFDMKPLSGKISGIWKMRIIDGQQFDSTALRFMYNFISAEIDDIYDNQILYMTYEGLGGDDTSVSAMTVKYNHLSSTTVDLLGPDLSSHTTLIMPGDNPTGMFRTLQVGAKPYPYYKPIMGYDGGPRSIGVHSNYDYFGVIRASDNVGPVQFDGNTTCSGTRNENGACGVLDPVERRGICVSGTCECFSEYSGGVCTGCTTGRSGVYCSDISCSTECINGFCTDPNTCTCAPGWTDSGCVTYYCDPLCDHGSCEGPNSCNCQTGYGGPACADLVCTDPCIRGVCTEYDTCDCSGIPGWTGDTCNEYECESPGCGTTGICVGPNTCQCHDGWTGDNCEESYCFPICENGGTCTGPNECDCPAGFSGPKCAGYECDPTCVNGYCNMERECSCYNGYAGVDCTNVTCVPECENGKCVGANFCFCESGWRLSDCSEFYCKQECIKGTCSGPNECFCLSGWKGDDCSVAYNCDPECKNGDCVDQDTCECFAGWIGGVCETNAAYLFIFTFVPISFVSIAVILICFCVTFFFLLWLLRKYQRPPEDDGPFDEIDDGALEDEKDDATLLKEGEEIEKQKLAKATVESETSDTPKAAKKMQATGKGKKKKKKKGILSRVFEHKKKKEEVKDEKEMVDLKSKILGIMMKGKKKKEDVLAAVENDDLKDKIRMLLEDDDGAKAAKPKKQQSKSAAGSGIKKIVESEEDKVKRLLELRSKIDQEIGEKSHVSVPKDADDDDKNYPKFKGKYGDIECMYSIEDRFLKIGNIKRLRYSKVEGFFRTKFGNTIVFTLEVDGVEEKLTLPYDDANAFQKTFLAKMEDASESEESEESSEGEEEETLERIREIDRRRAEDLRQKELEDRLLKEKERKKKKKATPVKMKSPVKEISSESEEVEMVVNLRKPKVKTQPKQELAKNKFKGIYGDIDCLYSIEEKALRVGNLKKLYYEDIIGFFRTKRGKNIVFTLEMEVGKDEKITIPYDDANNFQKLFLKKMEEADE